MIHFWGKAYFTKNAFYSYIVEVYKNIYIYLFTAYDYMKLSGIEYQIAHIF